MKTPIAILVGFTLLAVATVAGQRYGLVRLNGEGHGVWRIGRITGTTCLVTYGGDTKAVYMYGCTP